LEPTALGSNPISAIVFMAYMITLSTMLLVAYLNVAYGFRAEGK